MDREEKIRGIRPDIEIEINGDKNNEENFMHATLRPILKLQHDLLLTIFEAEQHLNRDLLIGKNKTSAQKRTYLTEFISKNKALRNQLIGIITGLFTLHETTFHLENRKAINKRIMEMIITRVLTTMD